MALKLEGWIALIALKLHWNCTGIAPGGVWWRSGNPTGYPIRRWEIASGSDCIRERRDSCINIGILNSIPLRSLTTKFIVSKFINRSRKNPEKILQKSCKIQVKCEGRGAPVRFECGFGAVRVRVWHCNKISNLIPQKFLKNPKKSHKILKISQKFPKILKNPAKLSRMWRARSSGAVRVRFRCGSVAVLTL